MFYSDTTRKLKNLEKAGKDIIARNLVETVCSVPVLVLEKDGKKYILDGELRLDLADRNIEAHVVHYREDRIPDILMLLGWQHREKINSNVFVLSGFALVLENFREKLGTESVEKVFNMLESGYSAGKLSQLARLCSLPEDLQDILLHRKCSFGTLGKLLNFSEPDLCGISKILSTSHFSCSEIHEFLDNLIILREREGRSCVDDVLQIVDQGKNNNTRENGQAIRARITKWVYPRLSDMEDAYRNAIEQASLPGNVKISHPKNFEGGALRVGFQPKNPEEFKKSVDALGKIPREVLEKLFEHV